MQEMVDFPTEPDFHLMISCLLIPAKPDMKHHMTSIKKLPVMG